MFEYHLTRLIMSLEMHNKLVERIDPASQLDAIDQKNRNLGAFAAQGIQKLFLQIGAGIFFVHDFPAG